MIDTDKYDNEGIELSDGGTICFPEHDGCIKRIDKDGNTVEVRYQSNDEWQEWYELFATRKSLLAEVKRLRLLFRELINDMSADEYIEWCNRIGCPDGLEVEAMKNDL